MIDRVGDLRLWGYGDHVVGAVDAGAQVGRVVQVDRGECDVVTAAGMVRAGSDSVRAQAETAPVTGDWVEVVPGDGMALIARVLPRCTALTRRDAKRDREQVLAANFDIVGIVAGLDRPLPPGRFERMLVMARDSGAAIVVLLTKADRAQSSISAASAVNAVLEPSKGSSGPSESSASAASAASAASVVKAVVGDVDVLVLSVRSGHGLNELRSRLGPGRTLVLVGESGSGKSSLVNALAGAEVAATAQVRASDRRGRHTTTARRLVLLPGNGGLVIDTPGVRAVGLTDALEALTRVFSDIEDLSRGCRFANCAHDTEPDCAVSAAVQRGEMDPLRVERFDALRGEIEQQRAREAARSRSGGGGRR